MFTSVISSAARLSLAPARLAGRIAGSLLNGLRGDAAADANPSPSSSRTKSASRRRGRTQSKPASSRSRSKAQSKPASSRSRSKAQSKPASSRRRSKAQPKRSPRDKPLDDVTIARKVEATMSQGVEVDTSKLDVKVDDGVVRLHGEVQTPDLMSELERVAAQVSQVRRVENLLHLPKPPTPSPTDAVAPQSEASEELSTPTSGLRPSDYAAARKEPGTAPGGS